MLPAPLSSPPPPSLVVRTFRLPAQIQAGRVHLVGEFNGWSCEATPMRRDATGFVADVTLRAGRSYRYRFLIDGVRWENDWTADRYVPNGFGTDDSVVDVPAVTPERA
jgi:1,4-alpha-glucan branching enzyme